MSKIVRVFLASPSDVENERNEVMKIANEMNKITSAQFGIIFQIVNWESMNTGMGRPQQIVNRQASFNEIDLFIGILWKRFGSNPGENQYNAESGTEEEFREAYDNWNRKGYPQIKMFRSNKKANPGTVDTDQLKRVQDFFKEFSPEGKHPGLVKYYSTLREFRTAINNVLWEYVFNHNKKYGLATFPISEDIPARRWTEKANAIHESASPIKLMAHSGYSFLADTQSRYRQQIEEVLKRGVIVQIIINIPWSYSGLFCAIADNVSNWSDMLKSICQDRISESLLQDMKSAISNSNWYKLKVQKTISGYKDLHKEYSEKIQLRFYKYEIPASVLITEKSVFVEPYIMARRDTRSIQGLNTFEVQVSYNNSAWKNFNEYFDLIWQLSLPYTEDFETLSIEKIKSIFQAIEYEK